MHLVPPTTLNSTSSTSNSRVVEKIKLASLDFRKVEAMCNLSLSNTSETKVDNDSSRTYLVVQINGVNNNEKPKLEYD